MSADDPAFAAARANAEPMVVDEPSIPTTRLDRRALASADITVALGSAPIDLITAAADELATITGRPPTILDAPHEVYLADPSVLTRFVSDETKGKASDATRP